MTAAAGVVSASVEVSAATKVEFSATVCVAEVVNGTRLIVVHVGEVNRDHLRRRVNAVVGRDLDLIAMWVGLVVALSQTAASGCHLLP